MSDTLTRSRGADPLAGAFSEFAADLAAPCPGSGVAPIKPSA
ncbi:hypothetical protein OG618_08745 [Kitasatospora sp. NBC_01246]|nr:hypothetical protein [Kitasatospora sp. NBC_01246]